MLCGVRWAGGVSSALQKRQTWRRAGAHLTDERREVLAMSLLLHRAGKAFAVLAFSLAL
jgi:hypothetical protein